MMKCSHRLAAEPSYKEILDRLFSLHYRSSVNGLTDALSRGKLDDAHALAAAGSSCSACSDGATKSVGRN